MFVFMRIQMHLMICLWAVCTLSLKAQHITVLGIAQDAGYPQADCHRACCSTVSDGDPASRMVASLALTVGDDIYLLDATPDFTRQWQMAQEGNAHPYLAGIFLTHAHIGHYTGLMYLGREAMGADSVPVYCMPRMAGFLEGNGPWSQLIDLGNITVHTMRANKAIVLDSGLRITPILVPHRDEFSETVGFFIEGPHRSLLYIPDIDKWSRWEQRITDWIMGVDYALLDGTFYDGSELPNRDMGEIPHPFIVESMKRFQSLSFHDRSKVYFLHFNHTNPLMRGDPATVQKLEASGLHIAQEGMRIDL